MKKISLGFIIVSLLLSYNLVAQESWTTMMQDHSANLKDVQAAFNQWYAMHKPVKDDDTEDKDAVKPGEEHEEDGNYMLFKRWEWLMHSRSYPSGKLPDPAVIEKEYQNYLANQQNTQH